MNHHVSISKFYDDTSNPVIVSQDPVRDAILEADAQDGSSCPKLVEGEPVAMRLKGGEFVVLGLGKPLLFEAGPAVPARSHLSS